MLAPVSVSAPEPSLTSEPVPEITPEMTVAPAPPTLSAASLWIAPDRVSVPASLLMRLAENSVTAPCQTLFPDRLRSAPPPPTPAPLSPRNSVPTAVPPCRPSVAPACTNVPPAVAPSAVLLAAISVPALMLVTPA